MIACDQAERISAELADLREQWNEDLQHWTNHRNANRSQRKDLTALRILEDLPGAPVLTITTASRIHGIARTARIPDTRNAATALRHHAGLHSQEDWAGE